MHGHINVKIPKTFAEYCLCDNARFFEVAKKFEKQLKSLKT
jgi:hypothetical protein